MNNKNNMSIGSILDPLIPGLLVLAGYLLASILVKQLTKTFKQKSSWWLSLLVGLGIPIGSLLGYNMASKGNISMGLEGKNNSVNANVIRFLLYGIFIVAFDGATQTAEYVQNRDKDDYEFKNESLVQSILSKILPNNNQSNGIAGTYIPKRLSSNRRIGDDNITNMITARDDSYNIDDISSENSIDELFESIDSLEDIDSQLLSGVNDENIDEEDITYSSISINGDKENKDEDEEIYYSSIDIN